MKKVYLSLAFGAFFFGANAQQIHKSLTAEGVAQVNVLNNTAAAKVASTSTLMPATFNTGGCGTNTANVVYYSIAQYTATATYTINTKGYAFGTNSSVQTVAGTPASTYIVTDTRAAQKYNVTGTGVTVTDILVYAGKAKSSAGTTMIHGMIFNEDATTKAPNAQLGVTGNKALNTFTNTTANDIVFGTPVPVSAGNFFAAVESPAIGGATNDSLAILSTSAGCSSTDSLSWIYETVSGSATDAYWMSVKSNFNANLDLLIFPVINIPVATGINSVSKGDLSLFAAFPNPAANEVNINYGLNTTTKVDIEIYDVTGKLINTIKAGNLEAGNHTTKIDVSNMNSGVYMYSVKTEGAAIFSKFTVAK